MKRRNLVLFGVSTLVATALACSSANPATPVAPASTGPTAASDGSTLKASAPTLQSPINGVKLTSTTVVLTAGASTPQFTTGLPLQYRFQVMNAAGTVVDQALVPTTTWTVTAQLVGNATYTWRVRAEYLGEAGPWAIAQAFITIDPAIVNDVLTNGSTVGRQLGGRFIAGQGWQGLSVTDAIYYDIPTCDNCTVEFDVTNIGKGEGVCCNADLKFLSMGDANAFGDFGSFRDHPWKMHLNQRGDGDGTGLEIIWRNGGVGNGNPGDHRIKMNGGGPDFRNSSVFHFVVRWSPSGYNISVGTNGGPQIEYMADGFGGRAFAPPNHRIALGCPPRSESFIGIIYRNVLIKKNQ